MSVLVFASSVSRERTLGGLNEVEELLLELLSARGQAGERLASRDRPVDRMSIPALSDMVKE